MQKAKAEAFRTLHAEGAPILVLPNAWDAGSAKMFAQAGFPAVATTSAGVAFSAGLPDGGRVERDTMIDAIRGIVRAVDVPVTADIEAGYGDTPEAVAETVRLAIAAGVVGVNIEDAPGGARHAGEPPLYPVELAVERILAARGAADASGISLTINARTDTFLVGCKNAYAEGMERLNAYAEAGADCLFLPGLTDDGAIEAAVGELSRPLNVVAGFDSGTLNLAKLESMGVGRVSVGGSIVRARYALIRDAASEILTQGTFKYAQRQVPHAEMNAIMAR